MLFFAVWDFFLCACKKRDAELLLADQALMLILLSVIEKNNDEWFAIGKNVSLQFQIRIVICGRWDWLSSFNLIK